MITRLNVSALIASGGKIFLGYRSKDKMWALPGGKVEPGEHPYDALMREMSEEIEIYREPTIGFMGYIPMVVSRVHEPTDTHWVSLVYAFESREPHLNLVPKDDSHEMFRWYDRQHLPENLFYTISQLLSEGYI